MKKNIVVIAVVLAVLAFLGGFLVMRKGKTPDTAENGASGGGVKEAVKETVKSGLMGMLQNSTGVKCMIEDKGQKYTMIAKGEKVRIEGIDFAPNEKEGQVGVMVNDGEWVYIWSGKEGMKFNIKDMEAASQDNVQAKNESETYDWKNTVKELETSGAKYDCNPTVATDADFTPPKDVKFQDWGELLKSFQNMKVDPNQFKAPQQ